MAVTFLDGLVTSGDLTVSGGDIVLGGTGRIQGIDTISANTDATSKLYVDNKFSSGVTQITAGTGVTISPAGGTGNVTINASGGGGGTISGSVANQQIAVGVSSNTIAGYSYFKWTPQLGLTLGDNSQEGGANNISIDRPSTLPGKFIIKQGNTTEFSITTGGDTTISSNANLVLDCGSTDDITMASSSSAAVGIGTTGTLSRKLTVNGTIYSEQVSGEVMVAGNSGFETKFITIREGNNPAAQWGLQKGTTTPDTGIRPSGSVMLMRSSKDIAFRSNLAKNSTSFQNVGSSHLCIVSSTQQSGSAANVGIGTDTPQSKLQVNGGVQIADDTDSASADKVGTFKYRVVLNIGTPKASNSYVDMCMQTEDNTYEWVNIVTNNW